MRKLIAYLARVFEGRQVLILNARRSPRWKKVAAAHLAAHPACAACGRRGKKLFQLEVHHVVPFEADPTLELEPANLLTLCRVHHLVFGHLGDWRCWNPQVRADAAQYRSRLEKDKRCASKP